MRGRFTVNSVSGIRTLVEAGRGLHLGPLWAFDDAIRAGRLQAVLPGYTFPAYPLHAVYAPSSYVPAKIRAFVDKMARHVQAEPALSGRAAPKRPGASFGVARAGPRRGARPG
jgi:DNA-binding transcriptional LysR family regulator